MKIDNRVTDYMASLAADSAKPAGPVKDSPDQKGAVSGDAFNVKISSTAIEKSEDEKRLERLNSIRQQLAEGTYNISGKDVANKMLKVLKN